MERKLIILSSGDFGREILYAGLENNTKLNGAVYKTIAFIDEDKQKIGGKIEGVDVFSFQGVKELVDDNVYFIAGVGNPLIRRKLIERLFVYIPSAKLATIIHSSAVIMQNTAIEEGVFIAPNTTIAIGSHIKANVAINQNVSIGHDCIIEKFSVISPGCILSGRTLIGSDTFLGSGVVTYPGVNIGSKCSISAVNCVARGLNDNHKLILKPNAMILPN